MLKSNLTNSINQINSNLAAVEIYDFEIENPFINNVTYISRLSEWNKTNKIYKYGRVCWMILAVSLENVPVTTTNRVLKIADNLPNKFLPLSTIDHDIFDGGLFKCGIGIYPYGRYLYLYNRDTNKFPNWVDVSECSLSFVYISKE